MRKMYTILTGNIKGRDFLAEGMDGKIPLK
jgi:hypothetical protein